MALAPRAQPRTGVGAFVIQPENVMEEAQKTPAIDALNRIMELELAGVVKYTHYALMVYGYNRIPIVSWLKDNANESLAHAHRAG